MPIRISKLTIAVIVVLHFLSRLVSAQIGYPPAGIPLSTGTSWGSSYGSSGSGNVALTTSPVLTTPTFDIYEILSDFSSSNPAYTSTANWEWGRSDFQHREFNNTTDGTANQCENSSGGYVPCNTLGRQEVTTLDSDLPSIGEQATFTLNNLENTEGQVVGLTQPKIVSIACIGDSDTAGYMDGQSWCRYMAENMRFLWGDAGPGWTPAEAAGGPNWGSWSMGSPGMIGSFSQRSYAMSDVTATSNAPSGSGTSNFQEEALNQDLSTNSPDDTAACVTNGSTNAYSLTYTFQNITQLVAYTPVGSGLGTLNWSIDSGAGGSGSINETVGSNWAATVLNNAGAQLTEGAHILVLTFASNTKTCAFGFDGQNNTIASHNGYGVRFHVLAANSEWAALRNNNAFFATEVYSATTGHCQTSSSVAFSEDSLCASMFINMYTQNERNTGEGNETPAQAALQWATLSGTERTNIPKADIVWITSPDGSVNNSYLLGSTSQYATYMREMVAANNAKPGTYPPWHYIDSSEVGDFAVDGSPFCWNPDHLHLSDSCKVMFGLNIEAVLFPFQPRRQVTSTPISLTKYVTSASTGTAINEFVSLTSSGYTTAVTSSSQELTYGVCVFNCIPSATNTRVAYAGVMRLAFDATAAVVGDYVTLSTTNAGMGHDSGYSYGSPPPLPVSGCITYQGKVAQKGGTAGTAGQIGLIDLSDRLTLCGPNGLNNIPYSTTPALNFSLGNEQQFSCTSSGATITPSVSGLAAGQLLLTVIFVQNGTAACSWAWPTHLRGAPSVSATLSSISTFQFVTSNNGTDAYYVGGTQGTTGGTP